LAFFRYLIRRKESKRKDDSSPWNMDHVCRRKGPVKETTGLSESPFIGLCPIRLRSDALLVSR
jgi:hypothetical protein